MSTGAPWDHGVCQCVPHNDAMCVLVCGTCEFCVWSGGILRLGLPSVQGGLPLN